MNTINFTIQKKILNALTNKIDDFYLVGGTALSMIYYNHRESYDLDFFTSQFSKNRVIQIISDLQNSLNIKIELVAEQTQKKKIKMVVYIAYFSKKSICKIDFVEDFVKRIHPLQLVNGIKVLSLEDIYLRKVFTIAGHIKSQNTIGQNIMIGDRQEPKDFYDLYCLSQTSTPLSQFIIQFGDQTLKEGLIHWYRTYDRMSMRTGLLDLITPRTIDVRLIEDHFKNEIDLLLMEEISEE